MKRFMMVTLLAGLAGSAYAVDGDAVLGGAIGGGAGAAIGSAVGGRDGAIIGGAIGGATGAAVATSGKKEPVRVRREVVVVEPRGHHDNGLHLGHYKNKHGRGRD